MKSYLKLLLALLLVIACVFSYTACGGEDNTPDEPGTGDGDGDGTNTPTPEPPTTDEDEEPEETYLIEFVYAYTRETINKNGRKELKDTEIYVATLEIPETNSGLTAELIAQINAITYHGYSFASWHTGYDKTLEVPGVTGDPVDFTKLGAVTDDLKFYAERGNLAGANATWAIEEDTEAKTVTLKINGTGAMFDFTNPDSIDLPWGERLADITNVEIAEGITTIGKNSFANCTSLKEVKYASTIKTIGDAAFLKCSKMKKLVTPPNLESIGKNAYSDTGLTSVILNDGIKTLADAAFQGSNRIKTILIPASLEYVGGSAFHPGGTTTANSHALSKVYTFHTAESFEQVHFGLDNSWLTELATIYYYNEDTSALGSYWSYAKNSAGESTDVPVQNTFVINYLLPSYQGYKTPIWTDYVPVKPVLDTEGNPTFDDDGLPIVEGTIVQSNVDFIKNRKYNGYEFVKFTAQSGAAVHTVGTVITADQDVTCSTHLTASTSTGYSGILSDDGGIKWKFDTTTGTLTVYKDATVTATEGRKPFEIWNFAGPDDTSTLWTGATAAASKINSIVIEEGVEYIGRLAFTAAINVKSVKLPASLKAVHKQAFSNCSNLISFYCEASDLSTIKVIAGKNANVEEGTLATTALTAGSAAVSYAKTAAATAENGAWWLPVSNDYTLAWQLADNKAGGKTLTVGGDQNLMDFSETNVAPWNAAKDSITEIVIGKSIITIGENLANGYANVANITLHNKVTSIPASAFAGTAILADAANYEDGMLIVNNVLLKTQNVEVIHIPLGTNIIAGGAFDACTKITEMFVPSQIKYIHPDAFKTVSPEVIYYDSIPAGWNSLAKDVDFKVAPLIAYRLNSAPTEDELAALDPNLSYWYYEGENFKVVGCLHKWSEWNVTTPATCTEPGSRTHTCLGECKKEVTETIPALGHSFGEWVNSTTQAGKQERTCANGCGTVEIRDKVIEGQIGFVHDFNSGSISDLKDAGKITTNRVTEGEYSATGTGYITVKEKAAGDKYISFGRGTGSGAGEAQVVVKGATNADSCDADFIVISWDMIVESDVLKTGATNDGQWPFRVRLGGTGDATAQGFVIFSDPKGDDDVWGFQTPGSTKTFSTKAWHNFTLLYNTTTGKTAVYLDGEYVGETGAHANYKDGPVKSIETIQFHTRGEGYYDTGVCVGIDNVAIIPWDKDAVGGDFNFDTEVSVQSMIDKGTGKNVASVTADAQFDATAKGYATLVTENEGKYLEIGRGSGAGEIKYQVISKHAPTALEKSIYLAQFDIKVLAIAPKTDGKQWPIRIRIGGTTDKNSFTNVILNSATAPDSKVMNLFSSKNGVTADFAEWVTVSVVYVPGASKVEDRVKVYFDGVFAGNGSNYTTESLPEQLDSICFETRGTSYYDSVRYAVDNVKIVNLPNEVLLAQYFTEAKEDAGEDDNQNPEGGNTSGLLEGETQTPSTGTGYADGKFTFDGGTATDLLNAGKIGTDEENSGYKGTVTYDKRAEGGTYVQLVTVGDRKVFKFAKETANKDSWIYFMADNSVAGNAYVFETDFYLRSGVDKRDGDDQVMEFIGGIGGSNTATMSNSWLGGLTLTNTEGKYYFESTKKKVEITKEQWHTIKTEVVFFKETSTMQSRFYLDGNLVSVVNETVTMTEMPTIAAMRVRFKWQNDDGVAYFDNLTYKRVETLPSVSMPEAPAETPTT